MRIFYNSSLLLLLACTNNQTYSAHDPINMWNHFHKMQTEMQKLQEALWHDMENLFQSEPIKNEATAPVVNITEDDLSVIVKLIVPQVIKKKDDIEVIQKGNRITIMIPQDNATINLEITRRYMNLSSTYQEKREDKKDNQMQSYYMTSQHMARSYSLPSTVELKNVSVHYDDKTKELMITLPKAEEEKIQRISVI